MAAKKFLKIGKSRKECNKQNLLRSTNPNSENKTQCSNLKSLSNWNHWNAIWTAHWRGCWVTESASKCLAFNSSFEWRLQQDQVNNAYSAFILINPLISQSSSIGQGGPGGSIGQGGPSGQVVRVVRLVSWMIYFQKIYGFHALNHQIIEKNWDVTPVQCTYTHTHSGK